MSTGTLILLLLIGGALISMIAMHRSGGHSHGMSMGGCGGGHGHSPRDDPSSSHESDEDEKKPLLGKPGQHTHGSEPAAQGTRHRGC